MIKTFYAVCCDFCANDDSEEHTWPEPHHAKQSASDSGYMEGSGFDICESCIYKLARALETITGVEWDPYGK